MTEDIQDICQDIAYSISKKGLAVPAVFFLEMYKPFVGVFSCCAVIGEPLLKIFLGNEKTQATLKLLEQRENVETIICKIEEIEKEKKQIKDNICKMDEKRTSDRKVSVNR